MKPLITILLAVAVTLLLAACVTSSGASGNDAIMKVNGREVSARELITSPMMRQSIKQYLIADSLMREAKSEGITADEQAVEDQIQNIEQDALAQGMTIEEYLQQQFMTVDDVKESIRMQQMFNKLIEAKSVVTDADRDKYWNEHGDEVKYAYARDNHLTEAEATELTREDVADSLDERIRREKENETRQSMMDGLINGINLQLLVFDNKDEAKHYEDLIINLSKTDQAEEEAAEPEAQTPPEAGAGGAASSLGPGPGGTAEAGDDEAGAEDDGGAAGDSAEGAAEGETPAEPEAGGADAEGEAETSGE